MNNKDYETIYNSIVYTVKVTLLSNNGHFRTIPVKDLASLVITDTIENFYHSGYLIVANSFDSLERAPDNNLPPKTKRPGFLSWVIVEICSRFKFIPERRSLKATNKKIYF